MWVIGSGILIGLLAGLVARGLDAFPWGIWGVIVALVLAAIAFALGEYE